VITGFLTVCATAALPNASNATIANTTFRKVMEKPPRKVYHILVKA
jgi:hypothetical protein